MSGLIPRPSASFLSTSLACEGPAVLSRKPWSPSSGAAARGTRLHGAIERYRMGARMADILHLIADDDWPTGEVLRVLEALPPAGPISSILPMLEVECHYNPITYEARLGTPGTPDSPVRVPEGFWRGRTDELAVYDLTVDGVSYPNVIGVLDHKTGNPHFQPSPAGAQNAYFVVWLASYLGLDGPIASGVNRTQADIQWYVFQPEDIARARDKFKAHEERLIFLETHPTEAKLEKNKGCKFCPVKACPLFTMEGLDQVGEALLNKRLENGPQ